MIASTNRHQIVVSHKALCTILTALADHAYNLQEDGEKASPFGLTVQGIWGLYGKLTDIYED